MSIAPTIAFIPTGIKRNIITIKSNEDKELEKFKRNIDIELSWDEAIECLREIDRSKKGGREEDDTCCDDPRIIDHRKDGCVVCVSCGVVSKSQFIDPGPEWNKYEDTIIDPTRCGTPLNPLLPKSSMSTTIEGNSKLAKRVRWNQMPYDERALWKIFKEIDNRCKQNFNRETLNMAKSIFKNVREIGGDKILCNVGTCKCQNDVLPCSSVRIASISHGYFDKEEDRLELLTPDVIKENTGIKRGRPLRGVVASCVDRAVRNSGGGISEQELCKMFNVDTKHMSKGKDYVANVLDGTSSSSSSSTSTSTSNNITTTSLATRLCNKLHVDPEHIKDVLKILKFIRDNNFLVSKATSSVTAGCIYYTAVYHQLDILEGLSVDKIGLICGVSKITVQKIYDEIDDIIKRSVDKVNKHKNLRC